MPQLLPPHAAKISISCFEMYVSCFETAVSYFEMYVSCFEMEISSGSGRNVIVIGRLGESYRAVWSIPWSANVVQPASKDVPFGRASPADAIFRICLKLGSALTCKIFQGRMAACRRQSPAPARQTNKNDDEGRGRTDEREENFSEKPKNAHLAKT